MNPTNASNKNVIWTSSNESVATVSETGIIKALSKGKTTITVTTEDGNKKASCELTVTEKTNSDDDIYKSDNDNINNNTNKPDNTAATDKLPDTGVRVILIVVGMAIILIGTISFIKYRKYMEVK